MLKSTDDNRIASLDVLRGVACLVVVIGHFLLQIPSSLNPFLYWMSGLGAKGVWLFFMISGFVIFMSLERVKKPFDFIVSRASRLFPAYFIAVLFSFVLIQYFYVDNRKVDVVTALLNLTMVQPLFGVENLDMVYWTLQVELLFYGWMFMAYLTNSLAKIDYFLIVFLLISLIALFFQNTYADSPVFIFVNRALLLDYIFWFALGIQFYKLYKNSKLEVISVFIIMLALVVMSLRSFSMDNSLTNLCVVIFFVFLLFKKVGVILKPLQYFGIISYTLYLIHSNFAKSIFKYLIANQWGPAGTFMFAFLIVVLMASGITFLIEIPVKNAIRRYYRKIH